MKLLAAIHYDPSTSASAATTATRAMTALDTTNLRLSVTVPSHGMVRVRLQCVTHGNTNSPQILLGILEGSTVIGRVAPKLNASNNAATTMYVAEADFCLTGLTPGTYNWDAAYGVETVQVSSAIKWGGPNDSTANNAFGAFVFEVYDPAPESAGGSSDWTANERTAIRAILGIPASGTTPDDPTTGILDTIRDLVVVVDDVVDSILDDTKEIGAAGAGLTALAPAATALDKGVWTNLRASYIDNLSVGPVAQASAWTETRALYLDKLNISGQVAGRAEVTAIQNNTRVVRSVPTIIERPDNATPTTYRIELFLYDSDGNMEAPDSAPTVELVDESGNDKSSRLDNTTMVFVSTGVYRVIYSASSTDELQQLNWTFTVVEGGKTRKYGNQTIVVDTTAVDFTSSDRTNLQSVLTNVTTLINGVNVVEFMGMPVEMDSDTGNWPTVVVRRLQDTSGNGIHIETISGITWYVNDVRGINGTALTESAPGRIAGAFSTMLNVPTPVFTVASVNQTGDSFAIVNNGAHGNAAIKTETAAIKAKTDNLPTSPAAVGSQMNLVDNAITEAKISTPVETAGRPTGILAMIRRIFEWQSNRRQRDRSTGAVTLSNAAETGVLETQTQSTSDNVDTISKGA